MFKHRNAFWIAWLLIALLVSGCSSTRLGYRFLDDLVRWKIDDYVVLNDQQGRDLDMALDSFFSWHRREQLPAYNQFLSQQISLLNQPKISPAQLQSSSDKVVELARQSFRRLVPVMAGLIQTLDNAQVKEFFKNYDLQARKYEQERLLPARAKRLKNRTKRMSRLLARWIGSPTQQQAVRIAQWARQRSFDINTRLEQRRRFRSYLTQILMLRQQPQKMAVMLEQLMVYPDRQYTAAYRNYSDYNRDKTLQLLADIHASLTTQQKQTLLAKLKQYQVDFQLLSSQ